MLIIEASGPAGDTIEQAIRDALAFSRAHGVMVRLNLNDVPVTVVAGLPGHDDVDVAVGYFRGIYDEGRKARE